MTPDAYRVLQMAVQDGIAIGLRRAHKHVETPTEDQLIEILEREVMTQVCEWFKFNDPRGFE
jgi:hypothetical protein